VTRKSNSEAEGVCEQLDWIRREQFTYYLTIAYMVTDPTDWPAFRRAIYGGLEAALGLAPPRPTGPYPDPRATPDPEPQRQALALLDEIRDRFDPAINWLGFAFTLWDRRHELTSPRRGYTRT